MIQIARVLHVPTAIEMVRNSELSNRGVGGARRPKEGCEVSYAEQVRVIFNKLHIRHVPTSSGSLTMDAVAPSDSCFPPS